MNRPPREKICLRGLANNKAQTSLRIHAVWPRGYKTVFILNSAEHDIYPAHKYEDVIYKHDNYNIRET